MLALAAGGRGSEMPIAASIAFDGLNIVAVALVRFFCRYFCFVPGVVFFEVLVVGSGTGKAPHG